MYIYITYGTCYIVNNNQSKIKAYGNITSDFWCIRAVRSMNDASEKFSSLQELLKSAIFHRQQLKYEQTRRWANDIVNYFVFLCYCFSELLLLVIGKLFRKKEKKEKKWVKQNIYTVGEIFSVIHRLNNVSLLQFMSLFIYLFMHLFCQFY